MKTMTVMESDSRPQRTESRGIGSLKAIVTGEEGQLLHEAEVEFDSDLPEFRTVGGVVRGEGGEVTVPPLMWVKALDLLLDRLLLAGVDFATIVALSGAAQQHGSVWWSREAESRLASLSPDDFLHSQLTGEFPEGKRGTKGGPPPLPPLLRCCFTCDSPVWLDSSTSEHCRVLEQAVGGAEELARITGSRAYERFTGPQIRKRFVTRPHVYAYTEHISLVSSFACSLFLGRVAPLDLSDASGMNLLDINTNTWHQPLLDVCGDATLAHKLGTPVETCSAVGRVSAYLTKRYGFSAQCLVVAFTGDNPSALAGLRLRAGQVGLSLGTSDTLLLGLADPRAPPHGHVLRGPVPGAPYMALLCFSNGSLTRQAQRDRLAPSDTWDRFNSMLDSTVRGNLGNMGVYYEVPEIVPRAPAGRWLWDGLDRPVARLAPELEVRALLETQALARRAHAQDMGLRIDKETRVVATGGAAVNTALLQVFSDVFDAPVYVQEEHGNAAVLGACVRSADVWSKHTDTPLPEGAEGATRPAAVPYADAASVYRPMLERYQKLIATVPSLH